LLSTIPDDDRVPVSAHQLVAVPKSELDRREAEYQRKKVAEKKRKFA
jgi:hypothetical protein